MFLQPRAAEVEISLDGTDSLVRRPEQPDVVGRVRAVKIEGALIR